MPSLVCASSTGGAGGASAAQTDDDAIQANSRIAAATPMPVPICIGQEYTPPAARYNLTMRLATLVLIAASLLARSQNAPGQVSSVEPATARTAVERSLPFLEREGVKWMTEKGCASCHQVPFMLWSHNAAHAHGIAVDERKVTEWIEWTRRFSRTRREWFKLTKASLSRESGTALPAELLARLDPIIDKPFSTKDEFVAQLRQVLTREEVDQHEAALVKRALRPCEPGNDGGGLDTLSQLLLGRAAVADTGSEKTTAFDDELRDVMLRWQQPDGSWKAAGQLPSQNRPHAESDAVTTMWAVLALSTLDRPGAATGQATRRALEFLGSIEPAQSNESLVTALLVERKLGQPDRADRLLNELLSQQNPDGGWAWRRSGASDAFATGQALFALSQGGAAKDNNSIERARQYLIESQTPEGYWSVPSRAVSSATNEARLKKLEPIYRYWGTAWATIGLSHTLPVAKAE
jgi:hypothetical protein